MKVSGKPRHLWKAIDQDGEVLDFCITETAERDAAPAILQRLLKKDPQPKTTFEGVVVSPGSLCYGAIWLDPTTLSDIFIHPPN